VIILRTTMFVQWADTVDSPTKAANCRLATLVRRAGVVLRKKAVFVRRREAMVHGKSILVGREVAVVRHGSIGACDGWHAETGS
jgi:hypothetical protein